MAYSVRKAVDEFLVNFVEEDHDVNGDDVAEWLEITGKPHVIIKWLEGALERAYQEGFKAAPTVDEAVKKALAEERAWIGKIAKRYERKWSTNPRRWLPITPLFEELIERANRKDV